ncbi:MAG TPA: hypothetical protein VFN62_13360 [Acidobacteriaceae bacterium]|nr:hypothetical protein [Acidobacteriaceae bacterium]
MSTCRHYIEGYAGDLAWTIPTLSDVNGIAMDVRVEECCDLPGCT